MADDRELRVDVVVDGATEGASALDDVADAVERVEDVDRVDVTVDVDAGTAETDVRGVDRALDDLDDRTVTPTVKVQVDDDALRGARSKVDKLGDGGSSAGHRFGSNFASDTGTVLNEEAAGIAGDFGGAFETGLAAAGIDEALGGAIAGGVGIGVLALTALWSEFNKAADEAKKRLEGALEFQRSLNAGKTLEASDQFFKDNADLIGRAEAAGVSLDAIVAFTRGLPSTEAEEFIRQVEEMNAATLSFGGRLTGAQEDLGTLATKLREAHKAGQDAAEGISDQDRRTIAFLKSQQASTAEWLEFARNAGPAAKKAVADYIAETEDIPPEKITEMIVKNDPAALAEVERQIDLAARNRDVRLKVVIDNADAIAKFKAANPGVPIGVLGSTAQAINLTVNAGFGTDAFAVATAVVNAARNVARIQQGAARSGVRPRRRG
jgi:hypothetical protein